MDNAFIRYSPRQQRDVTQLSGSPHAGLTRESIVRRRPNPTGITPGLSARSPKQVPTHDPKNSTNAALASNREAEVGLAALTPSVHLQNF